MGFSFYLTYPYQPVGKINIEQPNVSLTMAARLSVTS